MECPEVCIDPHSFLLFKAGCENQNQGKFKAVPATLPHNMELTMRRHMRGLVMTCAVCTLSAELSAMLATMTNHCGAAMLVTRLFLWGLLKVSSVPNSPLRARRNLQKVLLSSIGVCKMGASTCIVWSAWLQNSCLCTAVCSSWKPSL